MLLEIGRVRRDERVVLAECDRSFVDNHGCGCVVVTVATTTIKWKSELQQPLQNEKQHLQST